MPPLVALAGALGSAAAVRWAYRTAVRLNDEIEAARRRRLADATAARDDLRTLKRDPETGAYRPD